MHIFTDNTFLENGKAEVNATSEHSLLPQYGLN